MASIGEQHKPVDWVAITSGTARYTADIDLPGELVAAVLRSPYPHARILGIDTRKAKAIPGVRAVLTAADLPARRYIDYRAVDSDRLPLARGVVRHVGEPVAVVAAESPEAADRALAAITVRYRRLPVLDTVAKALRPGAAAIHEGSPDNIAKRVHQQFGSREEAERATAHSVTARYLSSRQAHATMEPHTVMARWSAHEDILHVWAPSQNPRALRRDLAQLFALNPDQVRMHEVTVGGDFGGRTQISSTEALVCALSMATGRPVKLRQSRAEEFAFTKSRLSWDTRVKIGCDSSGNLTYLGAGFDVDNGAYNLAGPGEMDYGSVAIASSYRLSSYTGDGRCVYTTKQPPSSFRGAGGFAVNWTLECAIDELAEKAGMDPIDFRLRNALSQAGERSITGWEIKSSALTACLETVRREIDWDAKRAQGGAGRGVGVACSMHVTALRREYMLRSSAAMDLSTDGRITLLSGCGDAGTGQKTLICQAVAEVLDIDPGGIAIVTTDSARTPHDAGAGASRGSFVSVSTARRLAEDAKATLIQAAAEKFAADPSRITWQDGHAVHGDDRLGLGELAALCVPQGEALHVESEFTGEWTDPGPAGYGYEDISPTYSFAAQAVEVEVDQDTGVVRVVKVVAAHDSGTILNPVTARGQVEGGVVMGLGAALGEELIYEAGRTANPGYVDYLVPRAAETPQILVHFIETEDPAGPFGAKGLGEIVLLPTGAALTNAIAHAVGVRLREAPLTPDKVLRAMRAKAGLPARAGSIGRDPKRWWTEAVRRAYPYGLHAALARIGPRIAPLRQAGSITDVVRPASLGEALSLLERHQPASPLGGGTDLLARERQRLPVPPVLVDLSPCRELTTVGTAADGSLRIGGAVTLAALAADPAAGPALQETAAQIATPQIRQAATVAGNLCQAKRCWFYRNGFDCYKRGGATRPCYAVMGDHRFYHAVQGGHRCQAVTPSDLATTLIALDALARIDGPAGPRTLPLESLYSGPGEVVLAEGEVITAIDVPAPALRRITRYRKLALWHGAFAVATVCVSAADPESGRADHVRVVLGGLAPRPYRVRALERILEGRQVTAEVIEECAGTWLSGTHPLPGNHWKAFAGSNVLASVLRELFAVVAS
ncbi:molybdopterin cofactor-binding domain-containing protein [Streptomyces sp. NBC_01320]|uniref:molybdopterin cofactor-binding domain-containing protein n=1 Tax=Streptomyces sp. NBC_01320 TaxID=2903824 RepID=UPI002E13FFA3|nr:molybdopterin-dependent oxidoreductase [Streptomyces sp. NBC_01320]